MPALGTIGAPTHREPHSDKYLVHEITVMVSLGEDSNLEVIQSSSSPNQVRQYHS
jgi:hypothetical protein